MSYGASLCCYLLTLYLHALRMDAVQYHYSTVVPTYHTGCSTRGFYSLTTHAEHAQGSLPTHSKGEAGRLDV